jgi:hypothetical protein
MALAREILQSGRVPASDPFAYTPTSTPFVHHEWGAGVLAYVLVTFLGPVSLLVLKYALVAGMAAIVIACARRRGGEFANWALLSMPAIWLAAIGFAPVRAQAYTYLWVAALLWCLERDDRGHRKWIVPWLLAFPAWANLHGGCAVAFPILGALWVERVATRKPHLHLLATAAGMLALLSVNPYGLDYYAYLWRALAMSRPHITEWQAIWQAEEPMYVPYAACVAIAASTALDSFRRRAGLPFGIAIVAMLAVAGAVHIKLLPLFAIAFLCCVPGWLAPTPAGRWIGRVNRDWGDIAAGAWMAWLIALAVAGMQAGGRGSWPLQVPGTATDDRPKPYPVGAVEYLRTHQFEGNLMTPFEFGAYCTWKLYPRVRISIDGRYELVFSEKLLEETLDFYRAKSGWEKTLGAYKTDLVLVHMKDKVTAAMPQTGWSRVYSDIEYELYARPGLKLPVVKAGTPPGGTLQ